MNICRSDYDGFELRVAGFRKKCRYHKTIGESFSSGQLSPGGMCIHAFSEAYPECLSLLYNKKREESYSICPGESPVKIRIFKGPLHDVRLFASYLLRRLIRGILPLDAIRNRIFLEIVEVGSCPRGLKLREKFEFNIGTKSEICPAAFYSLYPFLSSFHANGHFPWGTNRFSCSDHKARIVFELKPHE